MIPNLPQGGVLCEVVVSPVKLAPCPENLSVRQLVSYTAFPQSYLPHELALTALPAVAVNFQRGKLSFSTFRAIALLRAVPRLGQPTRRPSAPVTNTPNTLNVIRPRCKWAGGLGGILPPRLSVAKRFKVAHGFQPTVPKVCTSAATAIVSSLTLGRAAPPPLARAHWETASWRCGTHRSGCPTTRGRRWPPPSPCRPPRAGVAVGLKFSSCHVHKGGKYTLCGFFCFFFLCNFMFEILQGISASFC